MNTEVSKRKEKKFKVGDYVSFSLKGIYKVDHIETLSLTGTPEDYYVLVDAFNKTIHKTYAPINSATIAGVRGLIELKEIKKLESFIEGLELVVETLENNSNKKMIAYEKRIKQRGFWAIVETYFCVDFDLKKTKRMDKRYVQFLDRLETHIVQEIALVTGETVEQVEEKVVPILKKYENQ